MSGTVSRAHCRYYAPGHRPASSKGDNAHGCGHWTACWHHTGLSWEIQANTCDAHIISAQYLVQPRWPTNAFPRDAVPSAVKRWRPRIHRRMFPRHSYGGHCVSGRPVAAPIPVYTHDRRLGGANGVGCVYGTTNTCSCDVAGYGCRTARGTGLRCTWIQWHLSWRI